MVKEMEMIKAKAMILMAKTVTKMQKDDSKKT